MKIQILLIAITIILLTACDKGETKSKSRKPFAVRDSTVNIDPSKKRFGEPSTKSYDQVDNKIISNSSSYQILGNHSLPENGYKYENPKWSADVLNAMKGIAKAKAGNDIAARAGLRSQEFDDMFDPKYTPISLARAIDNAYIGHVNYYSRTHKPNPALLDSALVNGIVDKAVLLIE